MGPLGPYRGLLKSPSSGDKGNPPLVRGVKAEKPPPQRGEKKQKPFYRRRAEPFHTPPDKGGGRGGCPKRRDGATDVDIEDYH